MAKVPPKAYYTLRIANRMRKGVHTLIAVEECIKNYLSIHYANAYSAEVSNTFSQIKGILDNIMDSLGIEYGYGAPKGDSYTPITPYRTAKSYFKMPIAGAIRDIKRYLDNAKDFIIEYLKDNELEGKEEIKQNLSMVFDLIDEIMNTIELDENYGAPCAIGVSFSFDDEEEEDDEKEDDEEDADDYIEYDYDSNNDDIDVLKSYCKEIFTLNNCNDKNYSALIDQSFENGMAEAIPVTLNDIAKIRKNIFIWANLYDYEDDDADQMTCELFLSHFNVETETHWDRFDNDDEDTYLPISSLLNLWFIIKGFQQYYQNH
jgi:hypothetical protein